MNGKLIKSVLKEYGIAWAVNRSLYSGKLKLLSVFKGAEKLFEKKTEYPLRLNIFNLNTENIHKFLQTLSDEKKDELIKTANRVCEGKILGFRSIILDYGIPINWQMNPLTGKACDIGQKWYKIPDFDKERGDIKIIWEASRFSHFITLARAYLLTKNTKYYYAFSDQLADWIENNPYSYGANFKCGQECSLRMVNGLLAYTVFHKERLTTDNDKMNIEALILRCYRKVLSNFFYAYKCIKNNHTISELMGMIVGAWCCEDGKKLNYAYKILDEVINEQFTSDGGYIQHSFNYERLALQDLELILSANTGHTLDDCSKRKILAAANLMYQCQDESGDMPNYGSNDGALVFPVTSCGYRDFRPIINTIHAIITGRRLYVAGIYDEELLWFDTEKAYSIEQKKRIGVSFQDAGLYTIRKSDSWAMIVLHDYKSRPAHMDQLHLDLWINGINVLCDGGTYSYVSEEGRALAKNSAHNTVVYENYPQMNHYRAFMICNWAQRGGVEYKDNFFYGEMISKNGYKHQRSIEATDKGYRIIDKITGDKPYKVLFHTPCEIREYSDQLELKIGDRVLCRVKSSARAKIFKAVRSLYYLKKDQIACIAFFADNRDTVVTEIEIIRQEK